MPNIREYNSPADGLSPSNIGVDATAQAARRIGAEYNSAAEAVTTVGNQFARNVGTSIRDAGQVAVDYEDHQQIMAGAAHGAELFNALNEGKDEAIKSIDPNDPSYGQKVEAAINQWRQDKLAPALDKFRDSFTTEKSQAWAEHFVDSTRQHMFVSSSADVKTAAGIGIQNAIRTTVNTASNTAMSDPSAVPAQLDLLDHSVTGLVESSPIKGVASAQVRSEILEKGKEAIVKAGAIGAIQKSSNPEKTAEEWGAKYPQYINGAELKQLSTEAKRQRSADFADYERGRRIAKEAAVDRSDATEIGYLQKLHSDDPQVQSQVTAKNIVNDPGLTRESKERMLTLVHRETKGETDTKISAQTSVGLFRRIADPNADPQEIRAAIIAARAKDPGTPGSLTKADFADAMKNLEDVKTPAGAALASDRKEFFTRFGATIDPAVGSTGQHSALGMQKMYEAEKAARRAEEDARKANQDPHSVYDPSSPNFFAKRLGQFRPTLQQINAYQAGLEKSDRMERADKETAFKPPSSWQYSASRNQYRDPSGKIYDAAGKEVK